MFASRGWMRFALLLNLLGSALLFLSFQATSSKVKIVTTSDGRTAMCMDHTALFVAQGSGFIIGTGCPEMENSRPVAVVTIERPFLVTLGFTLITLGFLLQYLAVPTPKTTAQIRRELKEAQKAENQAKKYNRHPN